METYELSPIAYAALVAYMANYWVPDERSFIAPQHIRGSAATAVAAQMKSARRRSA